MAEVRVAESDRKLKLLYLKERRHRSCSGKAYSWGRVYMAINQARPVVARAGSSELDPYRRTISSTQ